MQRTCGMKSAIATLSAAVLLATGAASAAVKTKPVTYKQGETVLQGTMAWDDAAKGKRPGVLVVHEWWGHNAHAKEQAKRLAKAGYVAFALDMYGKGKVATHPKDAGAMAAEATKDPAVVAARFNAALAQLKADPRVDPEKLAAVGYCMGGSIALTMALNGADLDAVSTFHAGLKDVKPGAQGTPVKARLLVNNGEADPMVPPEAVEAFKKEAAAAGAQAEVVQYPGAKHGFTNPQAGKAGMAALAYNAEADKKSYERTLAFFKDVFGAGAAQQGAK
jgi:dienelactone hydrolase